MKKHLIACSLLALFATTTQAADKLRMGIVVKIGGIPWFNAMETGIKSEAAKRGIDAWMVGPTAADPALQVRAIEDLIAQKVDIIGVVPNDPKVLEPVLKRAREAGIRVITHESPGQQEANWDFELVDAATHGINHMKALAECMHDEGKYAVYVGSLTVPLHQRFRLSRGIPQVQAMRLTAHSPPVSPPVTRSYRPRDLPPPLLHCA